MSKKSVTQWKDKQRNVKFLCLLPLFFALALQLAAQPVTGVWRGRITRGSGLKQSSAPVEIKLIARGDSIVGTAYYYGSGKSYIRYSLKGYFDLEDGSVKWQDYHMVDLYPKNAKGARKFGGTMEYSAEYSCPDGKILRLDGSCKLPEEPEMTLELRKMEDSFFPDEWDEVIGGYYTGMNRKEVVDSVWAIVSEPFVPKTATGIAGNDVSEKIESPVTKETIAPPALTVKAPAANPDLNPEKLAKDTLITRSTPPAKPAPKPAAPQDITAQIAQSNRERGIVEVLPPATPAPGKPSTQGTVQTTPPPPASRALPPPVPIPKPAMEQAFNTRKKLVQTEIPLDGDSLELRFYDNAEVDGDSISLFLNGKVLFQHVRLGTNAYIFRLAVNDLPDETELAMVAENLGAIPPNTAYMEAIVKGQRYSARLESTESSTAVIRLRKQQQAGVSN